MKPTVNVAAGVIWEKGKLLAAKRPEGKPRGGFWEFPGGKQEPGETMEEALTRELKEELGINCRTILPWQTLFHEYADLNVHLYFMHVLDFTGVPAPHEGQLLRWITPEEAKSMDFLPADVQVVAQLKDPLAGEIESL